MLQAHPTDSDVLMYFPMEDIWHERNGKGKTHPLDLHANSRDWMKNTSFGHWSEQMQIKGYQVDYISDLLLTGLQATPKRTFKTASGAEYKMLLIPAPHFVSLETMELWAKWVKQGLPVYFLEHVPLHPNSYGLSEAEKARWHAARESMVMRWVSDPINILERHRISRESMADQGISFIRKRSPQGAKYFVANLSNRFQEGMVHLAKGGLYLELFDPLTGVKSQVRANKDKEFFLNLAPGQSLLVSNVPIKSKVQSVGDKIFSPIEPSGNVSLRFADTLLKSVTLDSLQFWTRDSTTHDYWGKGTYAFDFELSTEQLPQAKVLHLDQVRDWVRVKLNGKDLGIVWSLPYQLTIPASLLRTSNHIELEVMNVSANRIRKLDRERVNWKNFYEINFVDIQYKPFDASTWDVTESGLQGNLYFSNR